MHKIKAVCHFKNTAFIVLQIKYCTWHIAYYIHH